MSTKTPALPPTTMAGYGLEGHLPRCRAVLVARLTRVTDPSRCDCGKTGAYGLRAVPRERREE